MFRILDVNELCSCYSKSIVGAAKQTRANLVRLKRHMKEKREAEAQQYGKTSEPNY